MEKMKKVLSIIMAVLLVFLLVSCGTADKPSEGKSSKTSEKTDKIFSDFSDSEKKQAFKDYLSSYSGQSDLTSQLISKSPKGTTSISIHTDCPFSVITYLIYSDKCNEAL